MLYLLLIVTVIATSQAYDQEKAQPFITCEVDIGFLLDGSGSVSAQNWTKELDFVRNFTSITFTSQGEVRVGVASFGNVGRMEIRLDAHSDFQSFSNDLMDTPYMDENTNLASGLRVLRTELFAQSNGGRPDRPNIAIVITDGKPTRETDQTLREAELLKEDGTEIYVVGIGNDIDREELERVASPDVHKYVYYARDFDELLSYVSVIVNSLCEEESTCSQTLLTMVLDNSGSIGEGNWTNIKSFAKNFISDLQIVPFGPTVSDTMVSVVSFSTNAVVEISLGDYRDKDDLYAAIDRIPFANQRTNTSGAIWVAMNDVLSRASEIEFVQRIMIIVGDGVSNTDVDRVIPNAEAAKAAGFRIFTVGVGVELDISELEAIASRCSYYHTFRIHDFPALIAEQTVGDIRESVCVLNKPPAILFADPANSVGNFVFVVDVSQAVSSNALQDIRALMTSLIADLDYGEAQYEDHISIVTYGSTVDVIMRLSEDNLNSGELSNKVNSINFISGSANLGEALRVVREQVMPDKVSVEDGKLVKDLVVVIASDRSINEEDVENQAEDLKRSMDGSILVFGVGSNVDVDELEHLASEPTDEHFYRLNSVRDLLDNTLYGNLKNYLFALTLSDVWTCDLEQNENCNIEQSRNDDFDWTQNRGGTPSRHTGPSDAYHGEYYMYIEASSPRRFGDEAVLYLPVPQSPISSVYCLDFYAHMRGWHAGALQVFEDRRGVETIRFTKWGHQSDEWHHENVQLVVGDIDKIGIRAVRGGEFSGDIAIDKLAYHPGPCSNQAYIDHDVNHFARTDDISGGE